MANPQVLRMARDLKRAGTKNDAPIWSRLSELALKPSAARRDINLKRIGQLTKEGDTVVFPGKVLGTGSLPHAISLCPFSISAPAARKLREGGGTVLSHSELIERNPTGRGVVFLG